MQNCIGLFIRRFLLHLQACFDIVYLGYIICNNAFFLFQVWQHLTIVNLKINSNEQRCLGHFAVAKQNITKIFKELSRLLNLSRKIYKIFQDIQAVAA